jgi:hypothetical protein
MTVLESALLVGSSLRQQRRKWKASVARPSYYNGEMKSRRQRLFDGFATASLTLLVLTAATCAIGLLHPEILRWESTRARVFFLKVDGWNLVFLEQNMILPNARGSVALDATHFGKLMAATAGGTQNATLTIDPVSTVPNRILGFASFKGFSPVVILADSNGAKVRIQGTLTVATMSFWMLFVIFFVLFGFCRLASRRDRARRRSGLCEVCGYDLRATPERCPECGTVPVKIAPA